MCLLKNCWPFDLKEYNTLVLWMPQRLQCLNNTDLMNTASLKSQDLKGQDCKVLKYIKITQILSSSKGNFIIVC